MSRPCRSRVLPSVWPAGRRSGATAPVSSSQRSSASLGMSAKMRPRVSPNQTGPSVKRKPVAMRSIAASGVTSAAKRGSSTTTSGSG